MPPGGPPPRFQRWQFTPDSDGTDTHTPAQIVELANERCDQENIHGQLKSGLGALQHRPPKLSLARAKPRPPFGPVPALGLTGSAPLGAHSPGQEWCPSVPAFV